MELVTLLWGLAQIVGTGVLTKVGENILDAASPKYRELTSTIQSRLPGTQTAKALESGQKLDYEQTVIDLKPIESDPEVLKLADEVRSLIAQDKELQAKLDAELEKVRAKNLQVNRDRSQGYQFNEKVDAKFIGGTHYHGIDPD